MIFSSSSCCCSNPSVPVLSFLYTKKSKNAIDELFIVHRSFLPSTPLMLTYKLRNFARVCAERNFFTRIQLKKKYLRDDDRHFIDK